MEINKQSVVDIFEELFSRYPRLNDLKGTIWNAYEILINSFNNNGTLFIAGNGGSAADSLHIAGELVKTFKVKRPLNGEFVQSLYDNFGEQAQGLVDNLEGGVRAISLPSFTALNTAIANDVGADYLFAQSVSALSKEGDVFLGISTSGNSVNIVNAMMVAKAKHLHTIVLTGQNECRLDNMADLLIHVPEVETFKIQEFHLPIYHALCAMVEAYYWN